MSKDVVKMDWGSPSYSSYINKVIHPHRSKLEVVTVKHKLRTADCWVPRGGGGYSLSGRVFALFWRTAGIHFAHLTPDCRLRVVKAQVQCKMQNEDWHFKHLCSVFSGLNRWKLAISISYTLTASLRRSKLHIHKKFQRTSEQLKSASQPLICKSFIELVI